jgi:hypothetical protein
MAAARLASAAERVERVAAEADSSRVKALDVRNSGAIAFNLYRASSLI